MRATLWAPLLGFGLLARPALAEDSPSGGARLSFVRAANATECIAAPALEQKVVRRMGRDPFTGPPRQWIEGVIDRNDVYYYSVQLFERDREGTTLGTRQLRAPAGDCHQLDDAMALAIALIIDPTLQVAPTAPTAVPHAVAEASSAPTNVAADPQPSPAPPSLPPVASAPDRVAPLPPSAQVPVSEAERTAADAVTVAAVAVRGVLPGIAAGVELVTQQRVEARGRYALRWSALYLPEVGRTAALAELSYGLTAVEAGACEAVPGRRVHWFACSALGIGAVHTVVHAPVPFRPGDRLWLALRLEGGLRVRLGGPVWAETRLFDLLAAERWKFRVRTSQGPQTAFAQSLLMPGLAFGLGLAL